MDSPVYADKGSSSSDFSLPGAWVDEDDLLLGEESLEDEEGGHHMGDLGNLVADEKGQAFYDHILKGIMASEIGGRSVIVHQGRDDLYTPPSGNAGPYKACGVISYISKDADLPSSLKKAKDVILTPRKQELMGRTTKNTHPFYSPLKDFCSLSF